MILALSVFFLFEYIDAMENISKNQDTQLSSVAADTNMQDPKKDTARATVSFLDQERSNSMAKNKSIEDLNKAVVDQKASSPEDDNSAASPNDKAMSAVVPTSNIPSQDPANISPIPPSNVIEKQETDSTIPRAASSSDIDSNQEAAPGPLSGSLDSIPNLSPSNSKKGATIRRISSKISNIFPRKRTKKVENESVSDAKVSDELNVASSHNFDQDESVEVSSDNNDHNEESSSLLPAISSDPSSSTVDRVENIIELDDNSEIKDNHSEPESFFSRLLSNLIFFLKKVVSIFIPKQITYKDSRNNTHVIILPDNFVSDKFGLINNELWISSLYIISSKPEFLYQKFFCAPPISLLKAQILYHYDSIVEHLDLNFTSNSDIVLKMAASIKDSESSNSQNDKNLDGGVNGDTSLFERLNELIHDRFISTESLDNVMENSNIKFAISFSLLNSIIQISKKFSFFQSDNSFPIKDFFKDFTASINALQQFANENPTENNASFSKKLEEIKFSLVDSLVRISTAFESMKGLTSANRAENSYKQFRKSMFEETKCLANLSVELDSTFNNLESTLEEKYVTQCCILYNSLKFFQALLFVFHNSSLKPVFIKSSSSNDFSLFDTSCLSLTSAVDKMIIFIMRQLIFKYPERFAKFFEENYSPEFTLRNFVEIFTPDVESDIPTS